MDELQDQVAELDQFAGGLGMADSEGDVDMVANPMLIELETLQKQVTAVNEQLHGQAEEDENEIQSLEMESQKLHAEIERVRDEISKNDRGKAPKRVVETTPLAYEAPAAVSAPVPAKSVRKEFSSGPTKKRELL